MGRKNYEFHFLNKCATDIVARNVEIMTYKDSSLWNLNHPSGTKKAICILKTPVILIMSLAIY